MPSTPLLEVLIAFSFGVLGFRAALADFHTEFSVLFLVFWVFQWWFSPLITSQPTRPMPNDLRWGGLITVARLTVACILLGFGTLYVVHTINLSDLVLNCNLASIFWSLFWKGSKTGSWLVLTSFRTELWGAICRFRVFSWSKWKGRHLQLLEKRSHLLGVAFECYPFIEGWSWSELFDSWSDDLKSKCLTSSASHFKASHSSADKSLTKATVSKPWSLNADATNLHFQREHHLHELLHVDMPRVWRYHWLYHSDIPRSIAMRLGIEVLPWRLCWMWGLRESWVGKIWMGWQWIFSSLWLFAICSQLFLLVLLENKPPEAESHHPLEDPKTALNR